MILTHGRPSPLLIILGYRSSLDAGLSRPSCLVSLSLFIVVRYLSRSTVMQWSSPVSLARPPPSSVTQVSEWPSANKTVFREPCIICSSRQGRPQDGRCLSGLDNNVQYVQWMCKELGMVGVLTRWINALSLIDFIDFQHWSHRRSWEHF